MLFKKDSEFGKVIVSKGDSGYPELYIEEILQCSPSYPLTQKNISIILNKIPKGSDVLDVGLGCGYSAHSILKNENVSQLKTIDINSVLKETLGYFKNDSLLTDPRSQIIIDDVQHFLAEDKSQYDFINIDLNIPILDTVSSFYSIEYFQILKKRLKQRGIIRLWAIGGNYEYVKAFYKTLNHVFDNVILKSKIYDEYIYNVEFIIAEQVVVEQSEEEKALQKSIDDDKDFEMSTLDNQIIGEIWYRWAQQRYPESYPLDLPTPKKGEPFIENGYLFPLDVHPGDTMQVGVSVKDEVGISSIKATFPHEKGVDVVDLELIQGDGFDGKWKGQWLVHDTIEKEYVTEITVENLEGRKVVEKKKWTDPPPVAIPCTTISSNSATYSANVGESVEVICASDGTQCTIAAEDETSGGYATIPADDTDIDCNGDTCSGAMISLTRNIVCVSSGEYNIRCHGTGDLDYYDYATLICNDPPAVFEDSAAGDWSSGVTWGNAGSTEGVDYPGQGDIVTIDVGTVTLTAEASIGDITISGGQLSFGSNTLNVDGNWTYSSGTVDFSTGSVNFNAASGTKTITSGGQTFYNLTIDDAGGSATYQPSDNMDINGNFVLVDGIFDLSANNPDIKVAGDFTLTGGTLTKGAGTINFDGDLTYTDAIGSTNIGNLVIGGSPEVTDMATDLVADTLTVNYSDTLNTHGYDLDIGGIIDINGTFDATDDVEGDGTTINFEGDWDATGGNFIAEMSSVTLDGSAADQNITTSGYTFYDLVINNTATSGSDDVNLLDNINVDNGIAIIDGDLNGGSYDINVGGSWNMYSAGTFTAGTSSVEFDDSSKISVIYGSTAFNNLLIRTPSKRVDFEVGTTNTVSNAFTVDGQASATLVDLNSTTPGTQWTINTPVANASVQFADVIDSESAIASIVASYSLNNGNNENWTFLNNFNDDAGGGNWNAGATWGNVGNVERIDYPGAGDVVTIDAGTVTLTADASVGDITIDGGELDLDSFTLNVDGNWTFTSGVLSYTTGSINFNAPSGTKTITSGNQTFYNVTINSAASGAIYQPVDNMDINGDFVLVNGTLDLNTNDVDVKVAGDFTLTGGTFTKGAGTINFDGDLTYRDAVGSVNIGNLVIGGSPETTDLASDLVADTLTINYSDQLNTNGYDLDIAGIIDINGTLDATDDVEGDGTTIAGGGDWDATGGNFIAEMSSVTLDGSAADQNITTNSYTFYDLVINNTAVSGSDDVNILDDLNVDNGITVIDGDLNGGSYDISVGGSWNMYSAGTFTAGTSSVEFDDSSKTAVVTGSTAFNNLLIRTASKRVDFEVGTTTTVSNAFTVDGQSTATLVDLNSTTPGTQWTINTPVSNASVQYADVIDSESSIASIIASNSLNNGNNDNWTFLNIFNDAVAGDWNVGATWGNAGSVEGLDYPGSGDVTTIDGIVVTLTADQSVGDITIGGSGRLSLSSYTLNADGNWTLSSGGVLTAGSGSVLFNASSGTKTIASNAQTFNNFTINATNVIYQPVDTLDINGGFTLVDGTFDLATNDPVMHVATTFILSGGTFTKGDGTVNFDGDLTFNDAIGSVDIGNLVIGGSPEITDLASDLTASTLTINYSDQLNTHGYDLDIAGIIDINGTLDATDDVEGDRTTIAAGGSWDMTGGTFTIDDSTVTFDSAVTGNTITSDGQSFYDLVFNDGGGDSGGWTLTDALITSNSMTVTASDSTDGVNLDGFDLTVGTNFTIATAGEVTASNSTINVSGNWDSSGGAFTGGSSTVYFTNDATIKSNTTLAINGAFYNVTINDNVDITLLNTMYIDEGVMTMGNNTSIADQSISLWSGNAGPTPFSLQATSDLTELSIINIWSSYQNGVTLPASQFYPSVSLKEETEGTLTYIGGDVKINGSFFISENGSDGSFSLDLNGNDLEVTSNLSIGNGGTNIGVLRNDSASTSIVTVGTVLIYGSDHGFENEINATDINFNVSGNWTNSGIFTPSTSSVTFDSTSGDQNITSGGMTFYDLVINNTDGAGATDDIVLVDALNVDNDLTITDGDLQPSGNKVNVAGKWIMNDLGTFTSGTGTVEFDDAAKVTTVYGGTTFYDLLIDTPSKQVDWQAGTTNTVSNAFTVDGQASGTLVDLSSTTPDVQWTINTQLLMQACDMQIFRIPSLQMLRLLQFFHLITGTMTTGYLAVCLMTRQLEGGIEARNGVILVIRKVLIIPGLMMLLLLTGTLLLYYLINQLAISQYLVDS
ncbi:MAG: hypothetical protein A2306_04360 [Omnitrophica WOR_2 bacterium RIFOXYB2_FULL_38_16]|nr:MAG: hypothetical protein A2306_04360 [Omnitrophica WOR_2 bacterium RIFOXYB2_FULL_38_16]